MIIDGGVNCQTLATLSATASSKPLSTAEAYKKKLRKENQKALIDDAVKARELGLTYGQYQAKKLMEEQKIQRRIEREMRLANAGI